MEISPQRSNEQNGQLWHDGRVTSILLYALTHALAVSLAGKVRVNSISPGWIDTAVTIKT